MVGRYFPSLRLRLLLLVYIALVPALGFIIYTAYQERQLAMHHAEAEAMTLMRLVSSHQDRYIEETRQLLSFIARLPQVHNGSRDTYKLFFDEIYQQHPEYATIAVARPDGGVIYNAVPTSRPVNISDRWYFQQALSTRDFVIGNYQVSRSTGKPSLPFAYPVLDAAGNVREVLIASLDLQWLQQLIAREKLPRGTSVTVRDRHGRILARYPGAEKWTGRVIPDAPVVQAMLSRQGEGMVRSTGIDSIPRIYVFQPLPGPAKARDIFISIGIPEAVAFAGVNRIQFRYFTGLAITSLLVLLVTRVASNIFVLRPVNVLTGATRQLAAGNFGVRTGLRYDSGELGDLARAFDAMAAGLEDRDRKLQQAEARYRALVEHIPAITYLARPQNGFLEYVSPQVETMLGFSPAQWADPEFRLSQVHPGDRSLVRARVTQKLKDLEPYSLEYRILTRDGREKWVRNEAVVVRDIPGGPFVQGFCFDITDRKRAEEATEQAFSELNQVFHAVADGLCVIDRDFHIIKVNQAYAVISGIGMDEIAGRKCYEVFPGPVCHTPDCTLTRILDGAGIVQYDVDKIRKDGTKIPCIVTATPYRVAGGKLAGIVENVRDVSERKRTEMEMARYERLNLVGEMAAGIGHEIRNPMTTVRGFLQLLGNKQECLPYRNYFDLMIEELDRANSIITEFLSLARNKPADSKPHNLNNIVQAMLPLIRSDAMEAEKTVTPELEPVPEIPLNEKEIRQLLLNLVRNGLEAMSPGGNLTIKTFTGGGNVVLAVRDQGPGIDDQTLEKLGTPFFTTKENGTGLGLAVCYKIAANHNATIDIETSPGGTTFYVRFPVAEK